MPQFETFVLELGRAAPSYMLTVNAGTLTDGPYWEHASAKVRATFVLPPGLAGREAVLDLVSERGHSEPLVWQRDHTWRPSAVGLLEIPKEGDARFYLSLPSDSFAHVEAALLAGAFRFAVLHGAPLKRRRALCTSFHLAADIDLEDY